MLMFAYVSIWAVNRIKISVDEASPQSKYPWKNNMATVNVNGTEIEKAFLEQNIQEARTYTWVFDRIPKSIHMHCIVCLAPIGAGSTGYRDTVKDIWLCSYCAKEFSLT
jgi:hypothetical protein